MTDLRWTHQDTRGSLNSDALGAWSVAKNRAWQPAHDGLFRVWLLSVISQMQRLGPTPIAVAPATEGAPATATLRPVLSDDPARNDFQNMLAAGMIALATPGIPPTALPQPPTLRVSTTDGDPPVIQMTAALPIVAGIVIVLVSGIAAAAIGWIVSQKSEIEATRIAADAKRAEMAAAITGAVELLDKHTGREVEAGKQLPFSDEAKRTLQDLRQVIRDTAGWEPPALKSVPNLAGITSSVGWTAWIIPIGIGLAIYKLSSGRRVVTLSPRN